MSCIFVNQNQITEFAHRLDLCQLENRALDGHAVIIQCFCTCGPWGSSGTLVSLVTVLSWDVHPHFGLGLVLHAEMLGLTQP